MHGQAAANAGRQAKSVELPADTAQVWAVIGDFNGLPNWHPGVTGSELVDGGRRRRLALANGGFVVEDLLAHDPARRTYSYTIVESALPISRHKATLSVVDAGAGRCRVDWQCEFETNGADPETVAGIFGQIFAPGLDRLVVMFDGQSRAAGGE